MKRIIKKIFYWKAKWVNPILLKSKYRNRNRYTISFHGIKTVFSTVDYYSKSWFFPRYDKGRIHEPAVTQFLVKDFLESKVFFDVGTHIGFYTCIAGRMMDKGVVVGFEMDVNSFSLLEKNIAINDLNNVTILNCAIAAKPSIIRYVQQDSPNAGLSIANVNTRTDAYVEVKAIALDDYCSQHDIMPDLIKIDVEGAEMAVLQGMKTLFSPTLKMYIELHEQQLLKFNSSIQQVITFLHAFGFDVYEIMDYRQDNEESLRLISLETLPSGNPMVLAMTRNQ